MENNCWSRNDISIMVGPLDNPPIYFLLELEAMMENKVKNKRDPSAESLVLHLRNSEPYNGFDISKIEERKDGEWEYLSYNRILKQNNELSMFMLERKAKVFEVSGSRKKLGTFINSWPNQSYFADVLNPTVKEIDAYFWSITSQDTGKENPCVHKLSQDYWPQDIFNLDNFDSPMRMLCERNNPDAKDRNPRVEENNSGDKDKFRDGHPELLIGASGFCSPSTRALNSFGMLNLLVRGGPAMWITIHPEDNIKYIEWVKKNLNSECDAVLDGSGRIVPPRELARAGVRFFTALQKEGDLMVLFPGVFHLTWNLAFTIQSTCVYFPVKPKFREPIIKHKGCTCSTRAGQQCKNCGGIIGL